MNEIIAGKKIVKSYGNETEKCKVLNEVSVSIYEGEFVAVMGSSGCGKSTLMFTLSGMDEIDEGKVVFDGKELSEYKEKELADIRRTEMGFVFQQPTMLKNLNIQDNIILPAMSGKRKDLGKIAEKAKELMIKTGIDGLYNRDITQVSGGQLQRAGICRALINNPKIVFGDEPTGALNSKSSQEIMDIFTDVNAEGTAVMLVTHDAKIAARTERILFMCDGNIVSEMKLSKYDGTGIEKRIKEVSKKMQEIGI